MRVFLILFLLASGHLSYALQNIPNCHSLFDSRGTSSTASNKNKDIQKVESEKLKNSGLNVLKKDIIDLLWFDPKRTMLGRKILLENHDGSVPLNKDTQEIYGFIVGQYGAVAFWVWTTQGRLVEINVNHNINDNFRAFISEEIYSTGVTNLFNPSANDFVGNPGDQILLYWHSARSGGPTQGKLISITKIESKNEVLLRIAAENGRSLTEDLMVPLSEIEQLIVIPYDLLTSVDRPLSKIEIPKSVAQGYDILFEISKKRFSNRHRNGSIDDRLIGHEIFISGRNHKNSLGTGANGLPPLQSIIHGIVVEVMNGYLYVVDAEGLIRVDPGEISIEVAMVGKNKVDRKNSNGIIPWEESSFRSDNPELSIYTFFQDWRNSAEDGVNYAFGTFRFKLPLINDEIETFGYLQNLHVVKGKPGWFCDIKTLNGKVWAGIHSHQFTQGFVMKPSSFIELKVIVATDLKKKKPLGP